MADDAAFLRAILAQPKADLPRLVYADWLGDHDGYTHCRACSGEGCAQYGHGDQSRNCGGTGRVANGYGARAELIRVQCEIAAWPCECDSEERVYHDECRCNDLFGLRRREWELLLGANPVRWPGFPSEFYNTSRCVTVWDFRRGFVAAVTCALGDWQQHGPALLACQPVERATLADRRPGQDHRGLPRWSWNRNSGWPPDEMPDGIFRRLAGMGYQVYPTEADALADLSRAAIAWATAEAKRLGLGVYAESPTRLESLRDAPRPDAVAGGEV